MRLISLDCVTLYASTSSIDKNISLHDNFVSCTDLTAVPDQIHHLQSTTTPHRDQSPTLPNNPTNSALTEDHRQAEEGATRHPLLIITRMIPPAPPDPMQTGPVQVIPVQTLTTTISSSHRRHRVSRPTTDRRGAPTATTRTVATTVAIRTDRIENRSVARATRSTRSRGITRSTTLRRASK